CATNDWLLTNLQGAGSEPIQGSCETLRGLSVCSRPAIEKLWPSRSSTVVRASRLSSDGMLKPFAFTAIAKLSSLTDGARRRLMMPFSRTVGVKANCTPNGWYWTLMTGTPPVPPGCTTGIGYSPPARNEAVSPESAIRSGSANRRTSPFVSKALRSTSRLAPLLARFASATEKGAAPESNVPAVVNIGRPGAPLPVGEPGEGTGFPAASTGAFAPIPGRPSGCVGEPAFPATLLKLPTPVLKPRFPPLLAPNHFTPNSRLAERSTSRKRTLSMTCCAGATVIAFTIVPPSATTLLAT